MVLKKVENFHDFQLEVMKKYHNVLENVPTAIIKNLVFDLHEKYWNKFEFEVWETWLILREDLKAADFVQSLTFERSKTVWVNLRI